MKTSPGVSISATHPQRWIPIPRRGLIVTALLAVMSSTTSVETLLAAQSAARPTVNQLTTAEIAKKASPTVVTIATSTSQGSGVIVHGSGLIATSLHVIRGNIKVSVKLANSDVYDDVNVVEVDEQRDLVLLRIKAVDLDPALLGNSEQVRVGDKVVLIGSPKGLDLTVSDGVISAVRDSGDGYRLFQTSAAASPGSSGGGMFNEAGQLVGILSAKLTSGENLNFAIPVNYLRGLMVAPSRAMSIAEFVAAYPAITQPGGSQRSTAGTASKATPANTDSLLKILDASGLKYKKNNNTSWVVSYSGDHSGQVDVYISLYEDLVFANSPVAKNPNLQANHLLAILKKNFEFDLVKVGLDSDNDLAVLTEIELRLLDGSGLKRIVEGIASAADDIAGILNTPSTETVAPLSSPADRDLRSLSLLQGHAGIRYDPAQWKQGTDKEAGVYQFKGTAGDLYMRVITERIEVPIENLSKIVLANAQEVDPKAKLTRQGWRQVNGIRMLLLEIDAIADGVPITYYYHCFSDAAGTIQLVGYTGRALMKEYRPAIDRFIAGFEVVRK